uniref:Uncharacterized protein n=1 Tax=Opuntia streptacantha TaxID=393608 RepID=A0A7C8ZMC0_OPUST
MASNVELIDKLERFICFIPKPIDIGTQQASMPKPIEFKYLIIGKVESPFHAFQAFLNRVISITSTRFAPYKMCHKWPSFIPQPGMILTSHFLILIHQTQPKPMKIVRILNKHLLHPLILVFDQHVYQCRLIICFKRWPTLQIRGQDLPGFIPNRTLRTHWCPSIQQVQ